MYSTSTYNHSGWDKDRKKRLVSIMSRLMLPKVSSINQEQMDVALAFLLRKTAANPKRACLLSLVALNAQKFALPLFENNRSGTEGEHTNATHLFWSVRQRFVVGEEFFLGFSMWLSKEEETQRTMVTILRGIVQEDARHSPVLLNDGEIPPQPTISTRHLQPTRPTKPPGVVSAVTILVLGAKGNATFWSEEM